MPTMELAIQQAATEATFPSYPATIAGITGAARGDMPAIFPASQAYYWSVVWQSGEQSSRADLEAGRFRDFDNPDDAIRWLLGD